MIKKALPWPTIQREVLHAIKSYNEGRMFVNVGRITGYIRMDTYDYPHFRDITYRAAQTRVTMSLDKLGWRRWNTKGCGTCGVCGPEGEGIT